MKYPTVFLSICISEFLVAFGYGMAIPFLPLYAKELGAAETLVGLIVSSFFIIRALTELPSGWISDRIGRRLPIVSGLLVGCLGAFICSLSVEPVVLIFGRMMWGSGTGVFVGSSWGLLFDFFPLELRGKAFSVFQIVGFIGFTIGPPFGGFTATFIGEKASFLLIGLMMLLAFTITFLSKELKISTVKMEKHRFRLGLLKKWSLIVICLGVFVRMFIGEGIMSTILPLYLSNLDMIVTLIGIIIGIRSLGMIISTIVGGFIANKVDLKKILLFGFLTDSIILFLYTIPKSFEIFLPIALFSGMASGVQMFSLTMLLPQIVPGEIRGTGIGMYRTLFNAGAVFGPLSLTLLLSYLGGHLIKICFYVGTITTFSTFILVLTTPKVSIKDAQGN